MSFDTVRPFVRAMRRGDVAEMERLLDEPHVMGPAVRAEAWIAAQPPGFMWFEGFERYAHAQQLARTIYGDNYNAQRTYMRANKRQRIPESEYAWFIAFDGSFQIHSFASRDAAYETVVWLLRPTLMKTTPRTIKWMLLYLAHDAVRHGDVMLLEMLLESAAFRTWFSKSSRPSFSRTSP